MHDEAWSYVTTNPDLAPSGAGSTARRWKSSDLTSLMTTGTTQSLATLIEKMASCKVGKPIKGTATGLTLQLPPDPPKSRPDEISAVARLTGGTLSIPILSSDNSISDIQDFMRQFGIRSYTHFPLDEATILKAIGKNRKDKIEKFLKNMASESESESE